MSESGEYSFDVGGIRSNQVNLNFQQLNPVVCPAALPDGSVLFYDRGSQYGEYHLGDDGYPVRNDGAVDDQTIGSVNWRYLICAKSDLWGNTGTYEWGPFGTLENLTDMDIGAGLYNTSTMIIRYTLDSSYWWYYIRAYNSQVNQSWFMPSKDELDTIYDNRTIITGQGGDAFKTDTFYWSSSEYGNYNAWGLNFSNNGQSRSGKTGRYYCRLLRRI